MIRMRPPPKKRVDAIRERREARKAARKKRLARKRAPDTLEHRNRVTHFDKHLKHVSEEMLRATLRTLATGQAVQDITRILESDFGLPEDVIDVSSVNSVAVELLRLELSETLVARSSISERSKRELIERIIARVIPNRDGPQAPTQPRQSLIPVNNPMADLEKLIARETRKAFPAKKAAS